MRTNLLFLLNFFALINFIKSRKNSNSFSVFIVELWMWLKCHPWEEIQEIKEIDELKTIDFNSVSIPFRLHDFWYFVSLETDHSSALIARSDFNRFCEIIIENIIILIFKLLQSTLIGLWEKLFITKHSLSLRTLIISFFFACTFESFWICSSTLLELNGMLSIKNCVATSFIRSFVLSFCNVSFDLWNLFK